jgi:hypothetical protein
VVICQRLGLTILVCLCWIMRGGGGGGKVESVSPTIESVASYAEPIAWCG